jgi:Purine catabolism regulatory protein-like family/PucR C-terminal helix-turn-helix domain
VLLRALVESPELRLRVLAGEEALDRPVAGVFTTDLLDPRRYLSGGEIVLTGLMWRRTPADSRAFVSALAGAGVAALAAGDAALGSVPPDLIEACRDHRLPLLEVPVDVSFAVITERVLRAFLPAGPGPAVARLRLLAAAEPGTPPATGWEPATAMAALFAAADAEYGVAGWVLSAAGRLVAGTSPAPDARLRWALARAFLGGLGLPATVTVDGAPFSLFGVPGPSSHRLACWFVGLAGDHAAWDDERRAVAAELAGLVARHRARYEEGRRAVRRSADAALHRVLEWQSGRAERADAAERGEREIAMALRRCGLAPEGSLVAVAVTAPRTEDLPNAGSPAMTRPGAGPHEAVRARVAQAELVQPGAPSGESYQDAAQEAARVLLEEILPGALAGVSGTAAVALVASAGDALGQVRDAVGMLAGVPGLDLPFGVSVVAGAGGENGGEAAGGAGTSWAAADVCRVVAEARRARRLAELLGAGVHLVNSAEFGSSELLLAMVPAEARRSFRAALLTPLLAYDRDHGTELVSTLQVFLANSGSWSKAAEAMFIHVNSLRYRIRRIHELTGRDPRSLEDQAALLLALQIRD